MRHSEEAALFAQVEGRFAREGVDIDYVFAVDGLVCIWDPAKRTAAPELMSDADAELISIYLRKRGRSFPSMKDAEAHYQSFAAAPD